jgi:small GTP-binding protein
MSKVRADKGLSKERGKSGSRGGRDADESRSNSRGKA